jgi:Arc/MetJ-type ribon-helix-helix transcriptional regulator
MSISFTPDQLQELMSYCERNERSASWVIRKALDDWLEKHKDDRL